MEVSTVNKKIHFLFSVPSRMIAGWGGAYNQKYESDLDTDNDNQTESKLNGKDTNIIPLGLLGETQTIVRKQ